MQSADSLKDFFLKPCPFCGGEATIFLKDKEYSSEYKTYVECKECHVKTQPDIGDDFNSVVLSTVAKWNFRID